MFGEHASFIIPAYLVTFGALAITTVAIILQYRARLSELEKLDASKNTEQE